MIRLLGAQTAQRTAIEDSIAYLNAEHPWAFRSMAMVAM